MRLEDNEKLAARCGWKITVRGGGLREEVPMAGNKRRQKKTAEQTAGSPKLEPLEPRVLLSTFTVAPDPDSLNQAMLEADTGAGAIEFNFDADAAAPAEVAAVESRTELVFVDTGVEGYETLVDDLRSSSPEGRNLEVFLLDTRRDGIEQITDILADYEDLDAVHIVTHGTEGGVQLGGIWLNSDSLDRYGSSLASWSDALSLDADLLFYGCDLAGNAEGETLVDSLAKLTGADVAASADRTGDALLGGDWDLEYATGDIETDVAIGVGTQQSWSHLLPVNAPPVNAVPGPQSTPQSTPLVFDPGNSNLISIGDPDAGSNEVEVTLTATNGTLTLGSVGGAVDGETLVNSANGNPQTDSDIAFAADGSYVVVWESPFQDGDGEGIYMQRFDASGVALGVETLVNTETADNQQDAAIAMDDAGNYVVVWQSFGQDKNNTQGIFGQRFDANGVAQGLEFQVSTTTGGDQFNADVAMDADGDFVVVWAGNGIGDSDGIFLQRYNAAGVAQGGETLVNTTTGFNNILPAVALDDAGNFVVAWLSGGLDGDSWGVYAQRFDASGAFQSAEFKVNTTTAGIQYDASVAMDADGDFVIVWRGNGLGDSLGIFLQRYDAAGVAQGGETLVNTTTADTQNEPSVGMDNAGNFVVAWKSNLQDGSFAGIYAQKFDAAGATQGGEFLVNTTTDLAQSTPTVAMHDAGFAVIWQGNGDQPGQIESNGVFLQRYENSMGLTFSVGDGTDDASMTFTGTIAAINTALDGLQFDPTPAFIGSASVSITTDDQGNTGTGGAQSDNDVVNITVGANTPPTAVNDSASVNEGAAVIINLSGNDTDPDNALDLGSIVITSGPSNGILADNGDGTFT